MAGLDAFKENQEVAVVDTSKKVRVGIIGTGWIAESHMIALKKQPDVEIVAGADIIPGKAEAFFKKFGIEGAKTDYKDGCLVVELEHFSDYVIVNTAAEEEDEPTEPTVPEETTKPTEPTVPEETQKPTEPTVPEETQKPTKPTNPAVPIPEPVALFSI